MKIKVQRLIKIWIKENYDVEDLSKEFIDDITNYERECYDIEVLWDTQEDLGPVDIYDY